VRIAPAGSVVGRYAGYHAGMPPKTQREREAEQRQLKLDRMQEQVEEGTLVIRKMTDEERARFESKRRDRPQSANAKRRGRPSRASRSAPRVPRA
jgi:hypothetical protein